MIRVILPATAFIFLASPSHAEEIVVGDVPAQKQIDMSTCDITGAGDSCARFLACIGTDGLWIDGQALGWNSGTVVGQRNDGVVCNGTWDSGVGSSGSGSVSFECRDGSSGQASFYYQDSLTGTAIARGTDTMGRHIQAWSGQNVLRFLGNGDVLAAELPCTDSAIPIG